MAVGAIGGVEGLEVELLDRLDHEPGQMVLIQPIAQIRRQQQGLISIAAKEVLSHARIVRDTPDEKARSAGGFARHPRVNATLRPGTREPLLWTNPTAQA